MKENHKMNKKQFAVSMMIIVSLLAGWFYLFNHWGWLSSDPVARLAIIDPSIAIPDGAKSFFYDRGSYYFYEELPSENPQKQLKIYGIVFFSWIVLPMFLSYIQKRFE